MHDCKNSLLIFLHDWFIYIYLITISVCHLYLTLRLYLPVNFYRFCQIQKVFLIPSFSVETKYWCNPHLGE